MRVERSLYRQGHGGGRAVCPLALRAVIIEGAWTPWAAKQATWVVAHRTPQEGEELLALLGNMPPYSYGDLCAPTCGIMPAMLA